MCGIAGQISADPNKIAANYPAYCRMQKSLARRGPDQRGMYLHGHAALIHARLAVVDLENGCQPMVLDQGGEKYILVYNGELYNTPELHAQLAALGHRFVSHSDTEVLLHAFAQWGPDCLEKLNGIFAFAVWQQRAQKLFLARDRIGVKPLFYALRGDSLIFASELKTLLCHPEIPPQVDAHGLADVLLLGPGRTPGCGVFRNVQELKPGCCAEYTVPQVGAPRLTVRRYWQLTDHEHPDDFTHTAAKVRDLVMDAVTRQLVSDVQGGASMKLHELNAPAGARKAVTRKGRGAGSGNGKTAGYGHKGQKARSGVKKAGFEGGQMPLQRRLPKRGFNNIFATKYVTIKVSDLEKFEAGATVDAQALLDAGIISKTLDGVKVLGNGELTKAVNVKVAAYTASAKEKIEKAGGKAEVI